MWVQRYKKKRGKTKRRKGLAVKLEDDSTATATHVKCYIITLYKCENISRVDNNTL